MAIMWRHVLGGGGEEGKAPVGRPESTQSANMLTLKMEGHRMV